MYETFENVSHKDFGCKAESFIRLEARRMGDDEIIRAHRCIYISEDGTVGVLSNVKTDGKTVVEAKEHWNKRELCEGDSRTVDFAIIRNYDE